MKSLSPEQIKSISPERFSQYLKSNNWQKGKEITDFASVWTYNKEQETFALLLPLNPDFADFSTRMAEVIQVLAEVEQRPREEILAALEDSSKVAVV